MPGMLTGSLDVVRESSVLAEIIEILFLVHLFIDHVLSSYAQIAPRPLVVDLGCPLGGLDPGVHAPVTSARGGDIRSLLIFCMGAFGLERTSASFLDKKERNSQAGD